MITHEDITELKTVFDDRYVLQSECSDIQSKNDKRFASDDKRIDLILLTQEQTRKETKNGLKFNNWLTATVLGVLVAGLVTFLFMNFGGN
jgi:hypothetical protein